MSSFRAHSPDTNGVERMQSSNRVQLREQILNSVLCEIVHREHLEKCNILLKSHRDVQKLEASHLFKHNIQGEFGCQAERVFTGLRDCESML